MSASRRKSAGAIRTSSVGGMKQRAAMAIATSLPPKVIVADEPTSALDVVVQRQVMQTLGRLQDGLGAAVVLIGHDMGLIAQFADTVGVMYAGKLVEIGPVRQMIEAPRHPYTQLLIDSLPGIDVKRELTGIPGLPPSLVDLPPGCSFKPRCPLRLRALPARDAGAAAMSGRASVPPATCIPSTPPLPPLPARAVHHEVLRVSALIEVNGVTKTYGAFTALDNVTLTPVATPARR